MQFESVAFVVFAMSPSQRVVYSSKVSSHHGSFFGEAPGLAETFPFKAADISISLIA